MSFSNCKINLILTCSVAYVISSATGEIKFATTNTNLHLPVIILNHHLNTKLQDNAELLLQLKSGLKRTIN